MSDVRTNPERLWSRLMDMAEVGATPAGGSNRQALSDDDKAGRDLFVGWAERAGCSIELDPVGNLFARRNGTDADAPPVVLGSHLDTQPTGMIFVPCEDGLSHNEAESIEPEAAGRGAEVLLHATLHLAGMAS